MTIEKLCLLLKTMQYIIVIAYKKGICDDICPMRCHSYGGHGHGHGHGGHGFGGPGYLSQGNDFNVDVESLARAMGVPKNTFSELITNTSSFFASMAGIDSEEDMRDSPIKSTTKRPGNKNKPKPRPNRLRPINKEAVQFFDSEDRCETPDGRRGACLNIRACEPLLDLLRNLRSNPSAVGYLRDSICGYDGLDPIVCCPDDNGRVVDRPPEPQGLYRLPTPDDNCGMNFSNFTKKVVGGSPAALGAWPWLAVLGYRSQRTPGKTLWQCGATLITSRHVITASHCINGHEDTIYLVRLGELDLERDDEGATPIDVPIEQLIKHQEYNPKQYSNDIALVKMAYDVTFTQLITPICLPTAGALRTKSFERNNLFIAGWGAISFKGPASSALLELMIPVVTNDQCKEAYSKFKNQVIDNRVLCAGYAAGGKDACQGDSGGPLMFPDSMPGTDLMRYYLVGVVSYGFKCAEPGFPGVYTRLTEFIPWVEQQINA